jgi:uncharacterized protein
MTATMTGFVPVRDVKGAPTVKQSQFTTIVDKGDGSHLLYNTLTGDFIQVPTSAIQFLLDKPTANYLLSDMNPFQLLLFERGFLVPGDADEKRRSRMLYDTRMRVGSQKRIELILLPHENCNFRCSYCYETFARNKMEPWVHEAVGKFVEQRIDELELLEIAWFGGEPTLALDVIYELSSKLTAMCDRNNIDYKSQMTTNGYKLSDEVAQNLIEKCRVVQFQITLDGAPEEHDKRRHLADGGNTFDRIYKNLLNLRNIKGRFNVIIRVNFDSENAKHMESFNERLANDFASDTRFLVHFFPISRWGGAGDGALPICDANAGRILKYQMLESAVDKGFRSRIREEIKPMGTACYAADPNSFIIGADGTVYKCTVAFEDQRNHVGKLRADGTMTLDVDKYALWVVNDGVTDHNCQSCFFNPSCHGVSCPLWRMESQQSPCPSVKEEFPQALRILAKELTREGGGVL